MEEFANFVQDTVGIPEEARTSYAEKIREKTEEKDETIDLLTFTDLDISKQLGIADRAHREVLSKALDEVTGGARRQRRDLILSRLALSALSRPRMEEAVRSKDDYQPKKRRQLPFLPGRRARSRMAFDPDEMKRHLVESRKSAKERREKVANTEILFDEEPRYRGRQRSMSIG